MNLGQSIEEEKRLSALRGYGILDSQPEEEYDDLAKLASQICATPISLVSLVDQDRQWFKSNHGLSVRQTPRALSFCAHAIANPAEPMIISDSRLDKRFADNALVTGEPYVVFYAGVPMVDSRGFALGSLCVIDHSPRRLDEQQLFALRVLAKQVVRLLESRKLREALGNAEAYFEERVQGILSSRTQELEKLNRGLSKLNRKARENNEELKRSNLELQQFAYFASHDLQEPIRKIKAFSDLVMKRYEGELGAGAEYLEKIRSTAHRMSVLVTDLLELSKAAQAGPLNTVSLEEVFQIVLLDLELAISESGATITMDPLPTIKADKTHFCQLFQNLIGNSVKFRRTGVPIAIQIRYKIVTGADIPATAGLKNTSERYHLIQIIDNGVGFDQEQASSIFQPFHRLQRSKYLPGTGIGLAICHKVVVSYGGAIVAEGVKGEGAAFNVYLPDGKAQSAEEL
jgi:signal transduction histidine kinase